MEEHTYSGQIHLRQQLTMFSIGCQVCRGQHAELGKSDIPLLLAKHGINGLHSEVLAAQQDRISQVQLCRHNIICNEQKSSNASASHRSSHLSAVMQLSAVCFTPYVS